MSEQPLPPIISDAKPHLIVHPPDLEGREANGSFGEQVAICETAVIVSAPNQQLETGQKGRVYIYERVANNQLKQVAALTPPRLPGEKYGGSFGEAVAISNHLALIGAPTHNTISADSAGLVFVYEKNTDGTWRNSATIAAPHHPNINHPNSRFGTNITMSGNIIAISGQASDSSRPFVTILERQSDGAWSKPALLFPPSTQWQDDYRYTFGNTIRLYRHLLLIGEEGSNGNFVHIYKRAALGKWTWGTKLSSTVAALAPSVDDEEDSVDENTWISSIAINNDTIVFCEIGDIDTENIYLYAAGKKQLLPKPVLDHVLPEQISIIDVSLHDEMLLVSATINPDDESWESQIPFGAVFIYQPFGATWQQKHFLIAPPPKDKHPFESGIDFGKRIAIHQGTMVISEANTYGDEQNVGRVYLFELTNEQWVESMEEMGDFFVTQPLSARYTFDSKTAWNGRLQNVLNSVQTSETAAHEMVESCRNVAATSLADWYELTQINTLYVLLTNLRNFADQRVRQIFENAYERQQMIRDFKEWYDNQEEEVSTALFGKLYRKDADGQGNVAEHPKPIATHKMRETLNNLSTDLEIMQRALDQRRRAADGSMTTQGSALLNADVLATQAIKLARGVLMDSRYTRIITYFSQVTKVRVLPYDPDVILIGIPFASVAARDSQFVGQETQVPWDFLAIPHEIGHYLFRNGTIEFRGKRVSIIQYLDSFIREMATRQAEFDKVQQDSEESENSSHNEDKAEEIEAQPTTWLLNWMEELFCDIYGCIVAGPISVLGLQDILSDTDPDKLWEDNGHHPIPAIRPFIASHILNRIDRTLTNGYYETLPVYYDVAPSLLDENWKQMLIDWGAITPDQNISQIKLSVRTNPTNHNHNEDVHTQLTGEHPHFHSITLEWMLLYSQNFIDQILDGVISIFSTPDWATSRWSSDVKSDLRELEEKLKQGVSMPIEPFDKQPNNYGDRLARDIMDDYENYDFFDPGNEDQLDAYLNQWANKGPEGGIHGD